jgi:hypothetical protein
MLRGEYKPRTDDGVGMGEGEGVKRTKSERERWEAPRLKFEELTISDLQRLETLAGEFRLLHLFHWY